MGGEEVGRSLVDDFARKEGGVVIPTGEGGGTAFKAAALDGPESLQGDSGTIDSITQGAVEMFPFGDDEVASLRRDGDGFPTNAGEALLAFFIGREEEADAIRSMRYTDPNWRWNGEPIPEVKPPYDQFYAGDDGTVWVRVHQPARRVEDLGYDPTDPDAVPNEWREPVLYDVFDENGAYLGAVRAPDGISRYTQPVFTRDWVLAIVRDELDVQRIVKFRVEFPGQKAEEATSG